MPGHAAVCLPVACSLHRRRVAAHRRHARPRRRGCRQAGARWGGVAVRLRWAGAGRGASCGSCPSASARAVLPSLLALAGTFLCACCHPPCAPLACADFSLVDYNRAGVPLLEIVSEPDMRTGAEAAAYGAEIRRIMRFLGVSGEGVGGGWGGEVPGRRCMPVAPDLRHSCMAWLPPRAHVAPSAPPHRCRRQHGRGVDAL